MSQPFVSDKPAGENTSTLVLASANKHYVDIRILDPELPFPNDPCNPEAIQRLEWGFAGTAISTPAKYKEGGGELIKPAHTQWIHEIDNKIQDPGPEDRDEGYMYPITGTNEVLEKGAMINPDTGKVENYEEVWEDLDITLVGNESELLSWVLRGSGDNGRRGMVIRIGKWIQAVLRREEHFSVARWEWENGKGWERVLAIGGGLELFDAIFEKMAVGDAFEVSDGIRWECVSVHNWMS